MTQADGRVTVRHSSGPPGRARRLRRCGPVTATGNRDNKEIRSMSGPMSERAPDITVEADGPAVSTTVLVSEGYATPTQPLFTPEDRPPSLYPPGPFALLMSVLRQLTGATRLALATLSANHEGVLDSLCARLAQHELHLDLEGFPSCRSEEMHQAAVLQRLVLWRSSPSGAASTSMSSSLAFAYQNSC
jgi:hypothetical protein